MKHSVLEQGCELVCDFQRLVNKRDTHPFADWLQVCEDSKIPEFMNLVAGMKVVETARREYETLIPQIPFIGGAKNRWTSDLIESAQILALFRAMQVHGKTPGETAEVLYAGMQTRLAQYPRFLLRLIGRWQFSSLFIKTLQYQAAETHKHPFPNNFVAEVVTGDGKEFDWGIDFTECAILRFYRAQNALQFLPYVCRLDYLTSAAFGIGLVRTKTLANGDERCNPRLKQGRETNWDEHSV